VRPLAVATMAASPTSVARLGREEDEGDPAVALLELEEESAEAKCSPGREHAPRAREPFVAATLAATPSKMARLGREEDDADPRVASADNAHTTIASAGTVLRVALLETEERTMMAAVRTLGCAHQLFAAASSAATPPSISKFNNLIGDCTRGARQLFAAASIATTPPPVARRHDAHLEGDASKRAGVEDPIGTRTPTPRRLAVSHTTASPSSVAHLGREEDDADPSLAPFESRGSTRAGVEDPVGGRELGERQLVATLTNVAMPPPGARRDHVENVGEHFVLATIVTTTGEWSPRGQSTPAIVATVASSLSSVARSGHQEDDDYPVFATSPPGPRRNHVENVGEHFVLATDAASINAWSPRGRYTPATVATVASSLSSVARSGHQEDDDYPVLAASPRTNERSALAPKTVLGRSGKGGMASGFMPQVGMVAFRAGIG